MCDEKNLINIEKLHLKQCYSQYVKQKEEATSFNFHYEHFFLFF